MVDTNYPFRFKQFAVWQNGCAMKVNTDGVLLGAWTGTSSARCILDIGTGTGVIALMMAQLHTSAQVDAIDIDESATIQAAENFRKSHWHARIRVLHASLQSYQPGRIYDLIISNPPYFTDDSKTTDRQRNIAKHSILLSYGELVSGISRLLSDRGEARLVLPLFNLSLLEAIAQSQGLYITALTEVTAVPGKPPYLSLIRLERERKEYAKGRLMIQNKHGSFTDEYRVLTKDFYLKF